MRGEDERSGSLFSYVDLEARIGQSHPLRAIRALVNEALAVLVSDFSALYSSIGRPSIHRRNYYGRYCCKCWQLMERLEFDLLFRRPRYRRCGVGSLGIFQEIARPSGRIY